MPRVTHEQFVKAKKDRISKFLNTAISAVERGKFREAEALCGWCVMEIRELALEKESNLESGERKG